MTIGYKIEWMSKKSSIFSTHETPARGGGSGLSWTVGTRPEGGKGAAADCRWKPPPQSLFFEKDSDYSPQTAPRDCRGGG